MTKINPAAPAPEAPLSTVAAGPPKCDDCDAPAVFAYAFPWTGQGSSGVCCAQHAVLKQQTADNLGRSVVLTALPATQSPTLTKGERIQLKAEVYALEEEVKELKLHGANLYNENTRLTQQAHAAAARLEATSQQLAQRTEELKELEQDHEKLLAAHGELGAEASRLRTLVKLAPSPESTHGLQGDSEHTE